jgi:hypothetical protein
MLDNFELEQSSKNSHPPISPLASHQQRLGRITDDVVRKAQVTACPKVVPKKHTLGHARINNGFAA